MTVTLSWETSLYGVPVHVGLLSVSSGMDSGFAEGFVTDGGVLSSIQNMPLTTSRICLAQVVWEFWGEAKTVGVEIVIDGVLCWGYRLNGIMGAAIASRIRVSAS